MDIKDLIGEATEYDKKLALEEKKPKSWCKSVSAFANTFGGALIFGISDDGHIVGLDNPEEDAEKMSEAVKSRLDPIPEFKLRFHKADDKKVLIILEVYKGDETPYYYSGDGVLEAFVRVGNESVKAAAAELKRLVLRGKNTTYDSQNSTYKVENFAFSKLKERYKKWTGNSFDDKDLISFGLVNEQGELTNAGALLADESPILCSRLFCTRWNGLNKSGGAVDALDDAEYSGSIIFLIENGEAFIKRNCKMKWRKTANSREEMPEYVERSYHEALVNALAHRDYLVNGSEVHIDIYDDRMEIYSPGGMPDGSMIQDRDPLTVPSTRRNPVLADVLNRLGYMERKGSGFGKIISGYEVQINYNENKRPSFRSDRYQFTAVMSNLNYNVPQDVPQGVPQGVPQDKLDARIMDLICRDSKISTEKMAIALGVSSKTIKRHLKEMDNVNYIGRGFSGHWEIMDNE
ncbi:winged helix-turn-helix transcriptional regulator [bacterium D16-51]|nr:winged helix-turn-helix transcriptional regulator [bacterium D16-59]RKI60805.1 winged helix-turn-helix transcriptional regulator [bacterium D16-51]